MLDTMIYRFLIFVANLVEYLTVMSNIFRLCIVCQGFVESVGALYSLLRYPRGNLLGEGVSPTALRRRGALGRPQRVPVQLSNYDQKTRI